MAVAYYLGIDGGGNKTACAVGDEHSVIATATAGASNITRVREAAARVALHQAIRDACTAAQIDPRQLQRTCIGVAGAGRVAVAALVLKMVEEVTGGEIEVVGDMEIALEAAFGKGPGVIVIAGTGSIAYGRDLEGRTARAGGWGFAISDEGSAHWIGRSSIAEVLRLEDEACGDRPVPQASRLFQELRKIWKVNTPVELASKANSTSDFAELLPAINSAANAEDAIAQGIFSQAGIELARLVALVMNKLFKNDDVQRTIPIAMVGGVFRHCARVRQIFFDEMRKLDRRTEVKPDVVQPVYGALAMARDGISKISSSSAPGSHSD